jgi:[protein-PII] uridylyltransferase
LKPLVSSNALAAAPESSTWWREAEREFFATGRAGSVQRALARATDEAAIQAYDSALAPVLRGPAAMFAVGSFGRGELFPFSAAGIVVVQIGSAPANLDRAVAEFVRLLWEQGVRPSHRACTVEEYLAIHERNLDHSLDLLDRRLLAGDVGLSATLDGELTSLFRKNGERLGQRLAAGTRSRHAGYRSTFSHREPDVKETPGGLRDLRVIAALRKLCPERAQSTEPFDGAAALLSMVRCFLHYRAREDRNHFDLPAQEALVRRFAPGVPAPLWMQDYFRHACAVFNEASHALDSCEPGGGSLAGTFRQWQSRFSNVEFTVARERVFLRRPGDIGADAEAVFRLLEFVARHGIPPAPETERRLQAAGGALAALCGQLRPLWPALQAVLSQPHADRALRVLRDTGLLSSVFPEWTRIEGLAANGSEQLYTRDEHTLIAIERICDLHAATDPGRQRFADLLSGIGDQAVLLFALLFHHAGEGAASLAHQAAARVGMPPAERNAVEFLVEHTDSLAGVAGGRDLDDPATVRRLAGRIGTVERLRLLAAAAYADIASAYSDAVLPLRLEQLWRAYLDAERELTRGLETERVRELPASLPQNAEFIRGFPMRYLRAYTAGEIEAHARLHQLSRPTGVAVEIEQLAGARKLTVVARDKPDLFACFAGVISSFGLDIVKAEAFSNGHGIVLDMFVFADPGHALERNLLETDRLQDLVRRAASGKTDAGRLLRDRPRREPHRHAIEPQVRFDSQAAETATLVEIVTEDRPGLLYSLATVFSHHACNIDVVLIDTRGRRAVDVFYVAREGAKLPSGLQAILQAQLVAACLGE